MSVFNKKYPPGSVIRRLTTAENDGSYDQWGLTSPAYNVEPVTNTSSSSCANNGRRTPRCARRSSPSGATRTVDNTVDLYAAKPDIRPESRCLPIPPAFESTPRLRGSSGNIAAPFGIEN